MRHCILADIHANFEALKAVLFDAQSESVDSYICLGDLVGYGGTPDKTIDLLQRIEPCLVVCGNHDRTIVDLQYRNPRGWHRHQQLEKFSLLWTHNQISPETRRYLQHLPMLAQNFQSRIHAEGPGVREFPDPSGSPRFP